LLPNCADHMISIVEIIMMDESSLDLIRISTAPLKEGVDISKFNRGVPEINTWICKKGLKEHQRNRVRVFYASYPESTTVFGLYTLSLSFEDSTRLAGDDKNVAPHPISLVPPDIRRADDLPVFVALTAQVGAEIRAALAHGIKSSRRQLGLDPGRGDGAREDAGKLGQGGRRC